MASEALLIGERHFVPDPQFPQERMRMFNDPQSRKFVVQCTRDGGDTWKTMMSEPPSDAVDGWVPILSGNGSNVRWVPGQNISSSAAGSNINSSSGGWIDFFHPGDVFDGSTFGGFKSKDAISITGAQISYFSPVLNTTLVYFTIVNKNSIGSTFGGRITSSAGELFEEVHFRSPAIINGGTTIAMKATITNGNDAGSFVSIRLLLQ